MQSQARPSSKLSLYLACSVWLASAFALPAPAAVVISEFLASNEGLLRDENQESPSWIEIHNTGPDAVNLGGWHLTDDAANLPIFGLYAGQLQDSGENLELQAHDNPNTNRMVTVTSSISGPTSSFYRLVTPTR